MGMWRGRMWRTGSQSGYQIVRGERFRAWAPALSGQGGRVATLEIIWVGIAHPEFPSLEIV